MSKRKKSLVDWVRQARKESYWFDWQSHRLFSSYLKNQLSSWDMDYLYKLRNR